MAFRICMFSTQAYDRTIFDRVNASLQDPADLTYHEHSLTQASAALAQDHDAVCIFVNDDCNAAVLDALHDQGVRHILLRCAGFNNVDVAHAEALGMTVTRVPAYSPEAVAEHAVALAMTLNRKTHRAYNRVREGNFSLNGLLGFTMHGKTVGIVGTGRIGVAAARVFAGFGCTVLGCDPFHSDAFAQVGRYVDLDSLLESSHVVSLHCPLTPDTHHLVNKRTLEKMRHGATLINTSRGGLLDTKAAIKSLKAGHLGALGIDVYEQEAGLFFADHSANFIDDDVLARLMSFPNVLVTGHQAFFTDEALTQIAQVTLDNAAHLSRGATPATVVLPTP